MKKQKLTSIDFEILNKRWMALGAVAQDSHDARIMARLTRESKYARGPAEAAFLNGKRNGRD